MITLVKLADTSTDVLVNVLSDGRRLGTLGFSKTEWADIERRGGVEVYVEEKTHRARREDLAQEPGR